MPIGNSPDLPEYDKEREIEQRLMDTVYVWWGSLSEQEQWDIIEDNIGIENINEETNPDEEYGNLSWDEQFAIYKEHNPQELLTEEEKDDIIGDIECHRKMVEGDEIE